MCVHTEQARLRTMMMMMMGMPEKPPAHLIVSSCHAASAMGNVRFDLISMGENLIVIHNAILDYFL